MTTGTRSTDAVWKVQDGFPCHRSTYRSWSGTNQASFSNAYAKANFTRVIPGRFDRKGRWIDEIILNKEYPRPPKRERKLGEHPYALETREIINDYADTTVSGTHYTCPLGGSNGFRDDLWTSNDDLALLSSLSDHVNGGNFNAGVALAESPKAAQMIGDTATRIALAYKSLRKGNIFTAWNALITGRANSMGLKLPKKTDVSNFWLQTQYGWVPLLEDAKDCAEYIAHNTSAPRQWTVVVTRYAGGKKLHKRTIVLANPAGGFIRAFEEAAHSKRIRALIRDVDAVQLVGLTDPAQIAWELLPWSFVADWFIPIGSYLSALNLQRSVTGTYIVTERKWNTVSNPYWVIGGGNYPVGDKYLSDYFSFTRSIQSSLIVPRPTIKPVGEALSFKRSLNAVALLVQKFGSR